MLRKDPLTTGHVYHIFNRGVNKGEIFFSEEDYKHFLHTMQHYKLRTSKFSSKPILSDPVSEEMKPKVEILAYCLMPNHFHFLIKQLADNGITWYMQRVINSYVHYINTKYDRVGPLLQGRFKNIIVESDEQLLHASRYIHLNPLASGLVLDLKNYLWSSYQSYIGDGDRGLSNPELVLKNFKTKKDYEQFVLDQADYAKSLEQIKHILLDY